MPLAGQPWELCCNLAWKFCRRRSASCRDTKLAMPICTCAQSGGRALLSTQTSKTFRSCRAVRQQGVLLGACQVGRQDEAADNRAPGHPAADSDGCGPRRRQRSLLAAAGDRPAAGLPAQGNMCGCPAAHTGEMIELVSPRRV